MTSKLFIPRKNYLVPKDVRLGNDELANYLAIEEWANNLTFPTGGSLRFATVTVGSVNSNDPTPSHYDYFCTGTDDDLTIQQAINYADTHGGKVAVADGLYRFGTMTDKGNGLCFLELQSDVQLYGMGIGNTVFLIDNSVTAPGTVFNDVSGLWDFRVNWNAGAFGNKVVGVSGTNVHDIEFFGIISLGAGSIGIDVNQPGSIYNCDFEDWPTALKYEDGAAAFVTRNIFGGFIGTTATEGGLCVLGNNGRLIDNVIQAVGQGSGAGSPGVYVKGNGCVVALNSLGETGYGTAQISIAGNENNVQLNTVRYSGALGTPAFGCQVQPGATDNFVTNNDLKNSGTTSFNDLGTGTVTTAGNRL